MAKRPAKNTVKKTTKPTAPKTPVASGRSPIVPARAVALEVDQADDRGRDEVRAVVVKNLAVGRVPTLSDTVARQRARDLVEVPANPKLAQARADLDAAVAARALSNWEVAMIESMIDLRDLQDVIDAMTAKQEIIRENVKLALAGSDSKTFKFNLGSATLAKGAETVTILDEKKIPFAYMISVPDKAKIGRALRVPTEVDGAKLTEGKPSLRISWED